LLELAHAGVADLGVVEPQALKMFHVVKVFQPSVGDSGASQFQGV
jgi:hypothetical protein